MAAMLIITTLFHIVHNVKGGLLWLGVAPVANNHVSVFCDGATEQLIAAFHPPKDPVTSHPFPFTKYHSPSTVIRLILFYGARCRPL